MDANGFTDAARDGRIDEVRRGLAQGLVDIQNESGGTAMIYAAKNGKIDIVELLISKGGNPSIRDNSGKSAMDWLKERHPSKVDEVQVSRLSITNFHQFLHRESRNFHC